MKNIFKAAILSLVFVAASCEEDKVIFDGVNGESIARYNATSVINLPVVEEGESSVEVVIDVTTVSNVDRTVDISIVPEGTSAEADQYTIDQSTVVIPAGSYNARIKITGHFDALETGIVETLRLNLNSVDGATLVEGGTVANVNIFRRCPVVRDEFIGMYNGVETPGPYNYVCEVKAGTDANSLIISNVWEADANSETRIILSSDPANTVVTFPVYTENYLYDNPTYGAAYIDPTPNTTSTVEPCTKTITLYFRVRVSAGTFAANTLVLTKM